MFESSSRRDFLKLSALLGAGVIAAGRTSLTVASTWGAGGVGRLTGLALADDALHLASAVHLAGPLEKSLVFGINVFEPLPGNATYFGGLMPGDASDVVTLVSDVREGWAQRPDDGRFENRLALAAGWLVHRAAARIVGPAAGSDEARTYQDAAVLRARSAHFDREASEEEIRSLLMEMGPRAMVRFHTLVPDYDDAEGWVMRLQAWRRAHAEAVDRYASAYANPQSTAQRLHVVDTNFFDADDPVIAAAAQIRHGEEAGAAVEAVAGANASLYGRALAEGMSDVLALSAYLDESLEREELEARAARN